MINGGDVLKRATRHEARPKSGLGRAAEGLAKRTDRFLSCAPRDVNRCQ